MTIQRCHYPYDLAEEQRRKEALPARAIDLATRLSSLGVETVEVRYDGCGDSGQIDEITLFDLQMKQLSEDLLNEPLSKELEDFFYTVLECRHGGWENNDGAYGEFQWILGETLGPDAKPGDGLSHDHNTRYTESFHDHHSGL